MEPTTQTHGRVEAHAGARGRRWGRVSCSELEDLWDRHGGSAYALACALLGDEVAAAEAVRLAMADLAGSSGDLSTEEARGCLIRHVHRRAHEPLGETPGAGRLPPVMAWVSQLARFQRESLALCVFGGLTHREAAGLLELPPETVADLVTAGLRELQLIASETSAACA